MLGAVCLVSALAAETKKKEVEQENKKQDKRGIFEFGGGFGGGHDFGGGGGEYGGGGIELGGGGGGEVHEHVKTIVVEKKIPVPYTVEKHVPYTVEKKYLTKLKFQCHNPTP